MQPILADLIHLLKLERVEDHIFRGESRDIGGARVFGGQVVGQALTAASYTVQGRERALAARVLPRRRRRERADHLRSGRGARRQELQ